MVDINVQLDIPVYKNGPCTTKPGMVSKVSDVRDPNQDSVPQRGSLKLAGAPDKVSSGILCKNGAHGAALL